MNATNQTPARGGRLRALLPTLLDVIVPVILYFLLKKLGSSDFWALTLAGVGTGVYALVNTIRRRKLDFIGILVLLEIVLSIGLLFITNDPRLVAIKPAFYTTLTGVYFLFTCVVGKPIIYTAVTPIATEGDPVRTKAYARAWDESRPFRLRERLMTAVFGVGLLIEAVLRIVIVYHWSPAKLDESFVISQLPGIIVIVAVLAFFGSQVPAISKIVDDIQEQIKHQGTRRTNGDAAPAPTV
ncbi:VC0807 family protein [Actinoplanes sp. TFC3]|uniref:VC0807 family protein n=1 Tax=Actinoplanes sp. TFC3 TaxID=1710355 RepID=UPI00082A9EF7|nr:VC0807 family protein [Actinoplanes sp. TFC3]